MTLSSFEADLWLSIDSFLRLTSFKAAIFCPSTSRTGIDSIERRLVGCGKNLISLFKINDFVFSDI
jgi:hypothetical protein